MSVLRRVAAETESRGHHAFGLAWVGIDGAIHTFKRSGPATANLGDLDRCSGTVMVIGHCRWATHGSPEDNRNNHPHKAGAGWFVHNGVVRNHLDLIREHALVPRTQCDSEVLGLLVGRARGSILARGVAAVTATYGPLAILGLWANPLRLLIARRGNPLWFSETKSGFWFASQEAGLPDLAEEIRNNYVGIVTVSPEGLLHSARAI